MSYAISRHAQYVSDVNSANAYFRDTLDLAGFQSQNKLAGNSWREDVRAYYNDDATNAVVRELLTQTGRVYATLDTGEIVRLHNTGNLYDVSELSPVPLIVRIVGAPYVKNTQIADIVSQVN